MGQEPPPDPPGSTHGCPPGGAGAGGGGAGAGGGGAEAQLLASRLYRLEGFRKSQVASVLRKDNAFSQEVAEEYLKFFHFEGQSLEQALRRFLRALVLSGETQERERILSHFSRRFHRCNPGSFPSPDAVHSLTCAIMLLNTDLHGQRLGRAMTCAEFVANLRGMMEGEDFPRELLKALYSSIRSQKLAWATDDEEEEEEEEEEAGGGSSLAAPRGRKQSSPCLELPGGPGGVTYHRGWLARKLLAEADGKKAPWGRRGWKPFQALLRGTTLYFLKAGGQRGAGGGAGGGPEAGGGEEALGALHALAQPAPSYTKRPNVFHLRLADCRQLLLQAPTAEEMLSWVSHINLVASLFSSPPFPSAVGSQRRFVRPILPAAPSRRPPEEQLRCHRGWLQRAAQELQEHRSSAPGRPGRGREMEQHQQKEEFLLHESRRYETYVEVLQSWLRAGARDLEGWEGEAGGGASPSDPPPTLTKAHSSPSLAADPPAPPPAARVRRNVSERRTLRRALVPRRGRSLL